MHPYAHSSTIHNSQQPKCPLREKCIKKMWNIYTMEYFLAIRKNKIIPFAAT